MHFTLGWQIVAGEWQGVRECDFCGILLSRVKHCGATAATDEKARALYINALRHIIELRTKA